MKALFFCFLSLRPQGFYFLYFFNTLNNKIALFYKYINITIFISCYINRSLRTGILPIIIRSLFASCFLTNFDFLLPQTAQFDKSIILPCFIFTILGFLLTLREKCPNTKFFLVRIFLYSDQKKLRFQILLTQCYLL